MAEPEARYLAALRAELGAIDWLVSKRVDTAKTKRVRAATRLEAMMAVAQRNGLGIELLDAEVQR